MTLLQGCAILATSSGGPAITSISPSSIVIMVDSTTLDISGLPTRISIGGTSSYSNSVFNKTTSTLGSSLPTGASIADFEIIRANVILLLQLTAQVLQLIIYQPHLVIGMELLQQQLVKHLIESLCYLKH